MDQLTTVSMMLLGTTKAGRGFWQKRLRDPLVGFLARGITPVALSRAIAVAVVCGVFPFLGATTLLTLGAGMTLRLNQPVMQTINYLLSPVQLLMIPVFVQLGAWILGANTASFSIAAMLEFAREGSIGDFVAQFWQAGVYAFVGWLVTAPLILAVGLLVAAPVIDRLAANRTKPEEQG
jgi:uncharacterized protein (DUF2062 family)|uniref:DUF2062 domain-containing protein n=1 Tax=Cephaloticoccus sp. TaxID=1985742 RepID=UPI00404B0C72